MNHFDSHNIFHLMRVCDWMVSENDTIIIVKQSIYKVYPKANKGRCQVLIME